MITINPKKTYDKNPKIPNDGSQQNRKELFNLIMCTYEKPIATDAFPLRLEQEKDVWSYLFYSTEQ